ncbi:MAG: hypothetical protein Q9196_000964 [Gyalolechia fulgens]
MAAKKEAAGNVRAMFLLRAPRRLVDEALQSSEKKAYPVHEFMLGHTVDSTTEEYSYNTWQHLLWQKMRFDLGGTDEELWYTPGDGAPMRLKDAEDFDTFVIKGYRKIESMVMDFEIRINTQSLAMRTGKIGLKHHLHRINAADSPLCTCGEIQTVRHVLLVCADLANKRKEIFGPRMEQDLRVLLSDGNWAPKAAKFMIQTGLLQQYREVHLDDAP